MTREERAARAAFGLAMVLFLLALPWPERPLPPCPAPREALARDGRTREVRCDGVGQALRGPARLLFGLRLDPNRASAESLTVLPGIGPARAAAIVAERERRGSLTWDRGLEMATHKEFSIATNVQVYFCDPRSPWQRGTNENTNRLLRQYFPKGTDLSNCSQADLNRTAHQLNQRPRKTLDYRSPAEVFKQSVASTG